jgi:hypothetical protein
METSSAPQIRRATMSCDPAKNTGMEKSTRIHAGDPPEVFEAEAKLLAAYSSAIARVVCDIAAALRCDHAYQVRES